MSGYTRPWTDAEDAKLRVLWAVHPIQEIASTLNRTRLACYRRGRALGIAPQGYESLRAAAERTGYSRGGIRRILNWAHVRMLRAVVREEPKTDRPKQLRWIVEPSDVDDAIARWHETETLECAAARHNMIGQKLRRLWLAAAPFGVEIPRHRRWKQVRISSSLVDEMVEAYRTRELLQDAAIRVGVSRQTLSAWLRQIGIQASPIYGVPSGIVDHLVEEKKQTSRMVWRVAA